MEFVGNPMKVIMPYALAAEHALQRVWLMRSGVPHRVLDHLLPHHKEKRREKVEYHY